MGVALAGSSILIFLHGESHAQESLSLVLTGLLVNAVAVSSSYARSQDEQARNTEKVKENIRELGVGEEARVKVKLHDGEN